MEHKNIWFWVIGIAAIVLLLSGWGMGSYGMMGGNWGYGMMGLGFMFLPMLLFWGAIIWLVVTLVNSAGKSRQENGSPLEILKKRFANGEITKKQYTEMKKELQ